MGEFILRGNCHIVINIFKQKKVILRVRCDDGALKLNSTNDIRWMRGEFEEEISGN